MPLTVDAILFLKFLLARFVVLQTEFLRRIARPLFDALRVQPLGHEKTAVQLLVAPALQKLIFLSIGLGRLAAPRFLMGTSKNYRFHPVPGGVCSQLSSLPIF